VKAAIKVLGITVEAADRIGLHEEFYARKRQFVRQASNAKLVWDGGSRFGRVTHEGYVSITKEEFLRSTTTP
jgi:hypothetical protein